jgi:hypothetical protein
MKLPEAWLFYIKESAHLKIQVRSVNRVSTELRDIHSPRASYPNPESYSPQLSEGSCFRIKKKISEQFSFLLSTDLRRARGFPFLLKHIMENKNHILQKYGCAHPEGF